jgi:hypothetical protein
LLFVAPRTELVLSFCVLVLALELMLFIFVILTY